MPALRWTVTGRPADTPTQCTVLATRLPMRSNWDVPRLLLWALRIRRVLASAPGLLGYSLAADLRDKTLWTVSAWSSRVELGQFERCVTADRPISL